MSADLPERETLAEATHLALRLIAIDMRVAQRSTFGLECYPLLVECRCPGRATGSNRSNLLRALRSLKIHLICQIQSSIHSLSKQTSRPRIQVLCASKQWLCTMLLSAALYAQQPSDECRIALRFVFKQTKTIKYSV